MLHTANSTCSSCKKAAKRVRRFRSGLTTRLCLAALVPVFLPAGGAVPIRVTCVGDSITFGICANGEGSYPTILQKTLLPVGKFNVTGFGASGRTMLKKGDLPYWNATEFKNALQSQPDVVTIMLGTNDAKNLNWFGPHGGVDSFVADYKAMIATFSALPSQPKIILAIPPPAYPPFSWGVNDTVINKIFPTLIRQLAKETVAEDTVVDVFDALSNQTCITCDGVHPHGGRGYREVAAAFAEVLNSAPPPPPPQHSSPVRPAGGVWLFESPSIGNGSVLVPFADFYPTCGFKGKGALAWTACYGRDAADKLITFNNGDVIWSTATASRIGSYRVEGSVSVGVADPCPGNTKLRWSTAANGTVVEPGEKLYFETELPAGPWRHICCDNAASMPEELLV